MRRLLRSLFRMPTWEQRKRTLYKQAWAVSVIAYAQLAFAMTFPHQYHRDDTTHVALGWAAFLAETFLYHTGLVVAIVAAAALWRRRWWLGGVALPVALLSVGPVWWSAAPKSSPAVAPPQVKVMSINLLMVNDDVDGMLAEIADEDPDVILLQEYSRHWHEAFQQRMLAAYPHYAGTHQEDSFGAAIYSGVPFVEPVVKQMQLGGMKLPQMRAVIELGGEPVALYNIHLLPPRRLDYTRWQRHQFADLLNLLTDEPHAIVLAGDFNFTQSSPMARDLHAAGFADAHDHAALGVGETWPVKGFMRYLPVPGLRIDHVYLSADLAAVEHRTGIGSGSDHRPVITTIARRLRR